MRTLAVIPARLNEGGINRKCMRLMHGKPLLEYAIEVALGCGFVDDVCVIADSDEVLDYAGQFASVRALPMPPELAGDDVTLDPVVHAAVTAMEDERGPYGCVVTLQPNSPMLSRGTLEAAFAEFRKGRDAVLSVRNEPRLSWTLDERGLARPAYSERRNRGQLPPNYVETGSFLIARRECVTPGGRLGADVAVFEVPEAEALWVDAKEDWAACESALSRKLICFRADGHRELGLGHIFRALTLSYEFIGDDVVFVCRREHREGVERLRAAEVEVVEVEDDAAFLRWLEERRPDVLVNDTLDTEAAFVRELKRRVPRVVTFEDLGPGAREADAVVNAIYEGASPHANTFTGKRYVCLRDEFLTSKPVRFSEEVGRVLVTFGGTDPLDLAGRLYRIALGDERFAGLAFDFVLGPGYRGTEVVAVPGRGIEVSRNAARVSDHMRRADVAFSSQGRTTFELACMGVPTIVMAQNEREQLHTFAQMDNGFINLGLGSEVSDDDIASTLAWLVGARSVRREMHRLMLANDLRSGIRRVKKIILGEQL